MARRKKKEVKKEQVAVGDTFYDVISRRIQDAKDHTDTWRRNQEKWHRLRMRIKKVKTWPFTGCANMRMPTIETKLRKLKSQLVKVAVGVRPVVQAIPSPSGNLDTAGKIEKWLDHLIMDIIAIKPKLVIGIDQSTEKGFYLFKPYWKVETTTRIEKFSMGELGITRNLIASMPRDQLIRLIVDHYDVDMHDLVAEDNLATINNAIDQALEGKRKITFEFEDVLYNAPDVALCNPEFVYVPADSTWHPQDVRMIVHEFYLPYDTVKRNVKLKNWSQSAINQIDYLKTLSVDNLVETAKETREGVERITNPSHLVKIQEAHIYYDLNGDGYEEKCIFTLAPEFHLTLRKITNPLHSGKFPFVKVVNELTDDRWFAHRGIPELIEDLVKEIDTQHNQKLDNQTWRNTPMISYRAGVVNPNLLKPMPGAQIPRQEKDDIEIMNNTSLQTEFSYKDEQMILESKIEELLGQLDFTLQSMINRRQPRTRGEVELQVQYQQMVFSLDADLYAEAFSELFNFIWELWCQYGDDETEFAYFGANGWEKIKLSKEEIQGKYKIIVRGNDQNFNPQMRHQKASLILQASMTPVALQMGIIQPKNLYNAYKRFYQTLDEQNWQDFITDPSQLPAMQQPLKAQVPMNLEDLTPAEQAQVKARAGIQPDVQGMAMQKEQELREQELEYGQSQPREPQGEY